MKIVLQKLHETPEELVPGDIVGEVSLEEGGDLTFSIGNDSLEARLRELFSKPLRVMAGDPSGMLSITVARSVKPGTPEFFEQVLNVLEGPEYRLLGRIEK